MKKNKFTKQQLEAISSLKCDIDELDNKPRRLFKALREFAEAFVENEEAQGEVIDSINQFEDHYYQFKQHPDIIGDTVLVQRKVVRELLSTKHLIDMEKAEYSEDYVEGYDRGVREAAMLSAKKNIDGLFDYIH